MSKKIFLLSSRKNHTMNICLILLLTFIACLAIPCVVQAQVNWAKTYGGEAEDVAYSIQQTSDSGYIIAGNSNSFCYTLNSDFWLLKLDSNGNVQWQKKYGKCENYGQDEVATSVKENPDGGYIIAGYTYSSGQGDQDIWILKIDAEGNVQWQKTYGGTNSDSPSSIKLTADGGYIVLGSTTSFGAGNGDFWVLKLDDKGDVIWQKTYGDSSDEIATSIVVTSEGQYVIAGYAFMEGKKGELRILRLASDGTVIWEKGYGEWECDRAHAIQTADGGFAVAGYTASYGAGLRDFLVLKIDDFGDIQWQKAYGGTDQEQVNAIQQTSDKGFLVAGSTRSYGAGNNDFWVLKLDKNGNPLWKKAYGGPQDDYAEDIQLTSDGSFVVAGSTYSFGFKSAEFWVIKADPYGNVTSSCCLVQDTPIAYADADLKKYDIHIQASDSPGQITNTDVTGIDTTAKIFEQCSTEVAINAIDPFSIPLGGADLVKITGSGFKEDSRVILRSGSWHQPVTTYYLSSNELQFDAPGILSALIADVCIENDGCLSTCLLEGLGYYDVNTPSFPFTPHIGITSGHTPVQIFIPPEYNDLVCGVKFDDISGKITWNKNGKIIAETRAHAPTPYPDLASVKICDCATPLPNCAPLNDLYKFATFSYLGGILSSIQVIDTEEDLLVDFHPYSPEVQSEVETPYHVRSNSFSIKSNNMDYRIPGRYAFAIMGQSIAKIDTGSNKIVKIGQPFIPPKPAGYYKDIDVALMQDSNIIVVVTDEMFYPGLRGGILTVDATTLNILSYAYLPDEMQSKAMNLTMSANIAYITSLRGPDGPPYYQAVIKAEIDNQTGEIAISDLYDAYYAINNLDYLFNLGADLMKEQSTQCAKSCLYQCLYYVAPDEDKVDVIDLSNGTCACESLPHSMQLSSPQDITVAKIETYPGSGIYDWKAFVVNEERKQELIAYSDALIKSVE